eukprot:gene6749-2082_t
MRGMNAVMSVDQAAACLVVSEREAERLGVPPANR